MIFESRGLSWRHVASARLISTAGKALLLAGMVLLGPVLAMEPDDRFVGPFYGGSIAFGLLALAVSYAVSLTQTWSPRRFRVGDDALLVLGRSVPLRKIASAYVVERRIGGTAVPTVEIELRSGDVLSVRVQDPATAAELVSALGFGPGGRCVRIDLARPTRRLLHPLLGAGAVVFGVVIGAIVASLVAGTGPANAARFGGVFYAVLAIASAIFYAAFKRLSAAPVVVVGNDGVVVEQALREARFSRARLSRHGSVVPVGGVAHDAERQAAVSAMIAERFGAAAAPPERAAAFARAGRDVGAWRAHVRSALDAGYRAAGASVDDAAAVLASPAATEDQRIGAALALRVAGEPPERVRIAAAGAVDPRFRVVLEAIADDADDARLEKALGRLG